MFVYKYGENIKVKIDTYYEPFNPAINSCIIHDNITVPYDKIMERISEVENYIKQIAGGESLLIGLLLKRSPLQICCMLASLKCGCAYLPINASWPDNRIHYVMDQSGLTILIVDMAIYESIKESLHCEKVEFIGDELAIITLAVQRKIDRSKQNISEIAYIIYTSGTTGSPKGVAVSRRALCSFRDGFQNIMNLEAGNKILSLADYSFDMFVPEGLLALSWGMTVIMADHQDLINPRKIIKILKNYKPQYMQIVPSALKLIMHIDPLLNSLHPVEKLMIGAEALPSELFEKVKNCYRGELYNLYGPTEATVWCTAANLSQEKNVHIGKCFPGCEIVVLDHDGNKVVEGKHGELFISGNQLADEYWNNPHETDDKFIIIHNKRYYKSGDIGFRDYNGNLHCIGRKDDQIKINGYRVELSEIEFVMNQHPSIHESMAASVQLNHNKQIIAFLVAAESFHKKEFYDYLEKELPHYVIPYKIVIVDRFEYNYNGKADRKKTVMKYLTGEKHEG